MLARSRTSSAGISGGVLTPRGYAVSSGPRDPVPTWWAGGIHSALGEPHETRNGPGVLSDHGGDPTRPQGGRGFLAQQGDQPVESVRRTLREDLDAAVVEVAGIADEPELQRASPDPPPEADALHAPADEQSHPLVVVVVHLHRVRPGHADRPSLPG